MTQRYQVVIVGGGPVGVALAVELGQRGVTCAVVERHTGVGRIPKGQNLTQRTLEHFYFWGCVEQLRAARLLPAGYPIGGLTAYGDLSSDYWYAPPGLEQVRSYYFQAQERLPQYLTEEVLRARLVALPSVTTYFDHTVTAVAQDAVSARVTVKDPHGGADLVLEADYVVGCDGSRSVVRQQAGIERRGPDFDNQMVLAVFRSTELHEHMKRFPERTTYRVLKPELSGVWQFFGRVDVGETWFFHAPVPRGTTVEDLDVIHGVIDGAAGFPVACEFDHIGFWEMRVDVATTYRAGRVFIAGDASHSHPPYGGFGLNTGLEDVRNLGWKLAAVLQGWGGDALLDSYSEERQPVFLETGEAVIVGGIERDDEFMRQHNPTVDLDDFEAAWGRRTTGDAAGPSYEPNYEGSSVVLGPPGASIGVDGSHSFAARAGHHLAPELLATGANVYEELGAGFTLLRFGVDDQTTETFVAAAASLEIPLTVINDSYEDGRLDYQATMVLVRPDQYVAWAGTAVPDDVDGILRKVTGRS